MKRLIVRWWWTLVMALALAVPAQADTTSWNSNSSGNYPDDTKWDMGAPTMSDTAVLNRGSGVTYTVTIPRHLNLDPAVNYASDRLIVRNNTVTLADGTNPVFPVDDTYSVTNTSLDESLRGIIIGQSIFDSGSILTTTLNTFQGVAATLGDGGGAIGTLNVNGGTLTTFTLTGSSDTAHELIIGRNGTGHLNVSGGATLQLSGIDGNSVLGEYSGGSGTAMVDGDGSTWTNAAHLYVGLAGLGTLTVQAGGTVANLNGIIANGAGSTGGVTVTGADSSWVNNGALTVGLDGNNGELHIEAGGNVLSQQAVVATSADHFGSVTVTGTDSSWDTNGNFVSIGVAGTGTLMIEAGGSVSTGGLSRLGDATGSNGTATVTGADSTWTNSGILSVGSPTVDTAGTGTLTVSNGGSVSNDFGALVVGNSGDGALMIQSAGSVSSDGGTIGNVDGALGTATVTGGGSTWTNTGALEIGGSGNGTLTISDGGSASSTLGIIADVAGSQGTGTGTVTVTGADSTWTTSATLFVGGRGTGTLTIEAGGEVSSLAGEIGRNNLNPASTGTVTIDDGSWTITSHLYIHRGSLTVQSGGSLTADSGLIGGSLLGVGTSTATVTGTDSTWEITGGDLEVGSVATGTLTVSDGGLVSIPADRLIVNSQGTLQGDGTVFAPQVINDGIVAPGTSAGALQLNVGNYTQNAGGRLLIELDGATTAGTDYDQLMVGGTLVAGGSLEVSLINDFMPVAGNAFDILDWAGLTGEFATIDLPLLELGLMWNASQLYSSGVLKIQIVGDYNGDGVVGAADYTVWRNTLGQTGAGLPADGIGDGVVDLLDYESWKSHYGEMAGSGAAGSHADSLGNAVPEPAAIVLVLFGAVGLLGCRNGRWEKRAREKGAEPLSKNRSDLLSRKPVWGVSLAPMTCLFAGRIGVGDASRTSASGCSTEQF